MAKILPNANSWVLSCHLFRQNGGNTVHNARNIPDCCQQSNTHHWNGMKHYKTDTTNVIIYWLSLHWCISASSTGLNNQNSKIWYKYSIVPLFLCMKDVLVYHACLQHGYLPPSFIPRLLLKVLAFKNNVGSAESTYPGVYLTNSKTVHTDNCAVTVQLLRI